MKGKNLLILIVVAAVLVGLAVNSSRKQSRPASNLIGTKLLPELPVNDVERIVVKSGTETVEVAQAEAEWVLPSRYSYPANFSKIRDTLLKLADMKIGQVLRVTDAQRRELRLMPAGSTNGTGTMVELLGKGGKAVASLLVGAEHSRAAPGQGGGGYPDGQYVSADDGKSVCLVAQALDEFSTAARDWMDTELLNVQSTDIQEIGIEGPGRAAVKLTRKADGSGMALDGLTAKEEQEASKVSGTESAIGYFRFDDVADPALTDAQTGLDKPVVYRAETKKGEIYTVKVGGSPTNETRRYVRVAVELKPAPPAPATPAATNTAVAATDTNAASIKAAAEEAAKTAEERKQLEESVQKLSAKVAKWTYLIDSYKAESLTAPRDQLVKLKEEKKEEGSTNAPPVQIEAPAPAAAGEPAAAAEPPAPPAQ